MENSFSDSCGSCHAKLPIMQCDDSARSLLGQSVTLSRFRVLSTPKPALMLTLAHSEVSNAGDDIFQHLLHSSHFSFWRTTTFLALFNIYVTSGRMECAVVLVREVKTDKNICRKTSKKMYSFITVKAAGSKTGFIPALYGTCLRFLHNQMNRQNQRHALVHI